MNAVDLDMPAECARERSGSGTCRQCGLPIRGHPYCVDCGILVGEGRHVARRLDELGRCRMCAAFATRQKEDRDA